MKNEKGVTLITLVIMIVILLILASIGVTSGRDAIESAKFNEFISELKMMQTKVNQLNQENKKDIGEDLTDLTDLTEQQKSILEIKEVSDILYNNKTQEQITEIKSGFKFVDKQYIKENLEINSIKRDYLVNIEKRIVISYEGFEYKGITYYMSEQLESGIYNVEYNNKNENNGNFELTSTVEGNKWKISVSNIEYNGYINNWQVKYQLEGENYWNTSNELSFYVSEEGTYNVKVVHGNEVDLGTKTTKVLRNGLISDKVNNSIIKVGDYVNYTPTSVSSTDTAFTDLVTELETYSGSTENTTSTLSQESLNWRVLDVQNGQVRLISDGPTSSKIGLSGYQGYNNAVYLIDKTCKVLYNNSTYASNVQNLKIEDLQDKMKTDYTKINSIYGKTITPLNKYYPSILLKEKEQKVTIGETTTTGAELELSEQTDFINQTEKLQATSLEVKYTYWYKSMNTGDFNDSKYYELFIKNGSNYPIYLISSRCVTSYSDRVCFIVRSVSSGGVYASDLYDTNGKDNLICSAFRPVITLNAKTQVDVSNIDNDGSVPEKAWVLLEQ